MIHLDDPVELSGMADSCEKCTVTRGEAGRQAGPQLAGPRLLMVNPVGGDSRRNLGPYLHGDISPPHLINFSLVAFIVN